MALKHPAVEAAERLENDGDASMLNKRTRAELKFIVNELVDGAMWDEDELADDVFNGDGSATVSKTELIALAETVARLSTEE